MSYLWGTAIAALTVVVTTDATLHGMSVAGWSFAALVFCVLVFPLYLLVRKPRPVPAVRITRLPLSSARACRACGRVHAGVTDACPYCQAPQSS